MKPAQSKSEYNSNTKNNNQCISRLFTFCSNDNNEPNQVAAEQPSKKCLSQISKLFPIKPLPKIHYNQSSKQTIQQPQRKMLISQLQLRIFTQKFARQKLDYQQTICSLKSQIKFYQQQISRQNICKADLKNCMDALKNETIILKRSNYQLNQKNIKMNQLIQIQQNSIKILQAQKQATESKVKNHYEKQLSNLKDQNSQIKTDIYFRHALNFTPKELRQTLSRGSYGWQLDTQKQSHQISNWFAQTKRNSEVSSSILLQKCDINNYLFNTHKRFAKKQQGNGQLTDMIYQQYGTAKKSIKTVKTFGNQQAFKLYESSAKARRLKDHMKTQRQKGPIKTLQFNQFTKNTQQQNWNQQITSLKDKISIINTQLTQLKSLKNEMINIVALKQQNQAFKNQLYSLNSTILEILEQLNQKHLVDFSQAQIREVIDKYNKQRKTIDEQLRKIGDETEKSIQEQQMQDKNI